MLVAASQASVPGLVSKQVQVAKGETEVEPAPQVVQESALAAENLPAVQGEQLIEPAAAKVPAMQGVQLVLSLGPAEPATHLHAVFSVDP